MKILNAMGKKVEPTLQQERLLKLGWSQYYHHNYWVNPKVITDKHRQDYTNYGMTELEALAWEDGYAKALVDIKQGNR